MRSTVVTKSSPRARCAAVANAVLTALVVGAVAQPGTGAEGSLDEACSSKQVENFEMAASATGAGSCAAASCEWSCGVTVATASVARLASRPKNTTPTTATPIAPPSCWKVVSTPEADPASLGGTPARMMLSKGAITVPRPSPLTRNEGIRSHPVTFVPWRLSVTMTPRIPITRSAEPIAIVHLPRRGATRVDIAEANAEARLQWIVVKPALSALNPSPTWTIRLKVKKNAGIPAMNTAEIATPTLNDLMRNSESWTRGNLVEGSDRSYRMKSTSITGLIAMQMNVHAGHPAPCPSTSG